MLNSEINNATASIQALTIPTGVNIASNSSPSLAPVNGALARDASMAGSCFIGNGSSWQAIAGGGGGSNDTYVTGITLTTGAANPNFTGCTLYIQKYTDANSGHTMAFFDLTIDATSAGATTPDNWTSPVGTIPAAFRPAAQKNFPVWAQQGAALIIGTANCIIGTNGSIAVGCTNAATANTTFQQASGVYQIN